MAAESLGSFETGRRQGLLYDRLEYEASLTMGFEMFSKNRRR